MTIQSPEDKTVAAEIYHFLQKERRLGSHIDLWASRHHNFAYRYHLSSLRSNLLRHFTFEGLRVLELGAGMGGISRYLAETCQHLHVVEEAEPLYQALTERLKDLTNWTGTIANIEEFSSSEKFDVVCLVGVLEHSAQNTPSNGALSPFDIQMQIAQNFLEPGGALIVAIENKLGFNYWNGAAEDHTGRMFESITGYGPESETKTFLRKDLRDLFTRNGFEAIEEFFAFPDFKFPTTIFHSHASALPAEVIAELACKNEFESYANIRQPFYPDHLAMLEVARAGLMPDMANSFLFVGFNHGQSAIRKVLLQNILTHHQKTWCYSKRAKGQVLTTFIQRHSDWRVVKKIANIQISKVGSYFETSLHFLS